MLKQIEVAEAVLSGKLVFTVMSSSGDDTLVCDPEVESECDTALIKFDEMMGKGYVAFPFDANGKQIGQINKTDWEKLDREEKRKTLFDEPKEIHMSPMIVGG